MFQIKSALLTSGVAEVHGALSEEGGLRPLVPMSMT